MVEHPYLVYVPPVPFRGTSVSPHWSSHDTLQHFLPLASWGKQLIEDRLVMYTLWNRFRSGFWTPGNARIWDPTARWPPDKLVCHSDVSWRTGSPWDVLWFYLGEFLNTRARVAIDFITWYQDLPKWLYFQYRCMVNKRNNCLFT